MRKSLAGKMLAIYIPSLFVILAVMAGMIFMAINHRVQPDNLVVIALVSAVICLLVFFAIVVATTLVLTRPMRRLVKGARTIASGDLDVELAISSQDEIGEVAAALDQIIAYQKRISATVANIADGNLTVQTTINSERDILGQNINRMVANLKNLVQELKIEADQMQSSSEKLAISSFHSGDAASQISTTIQQVARGVSSSTESISRTAASIDEMGRSIDGIARGAQDQAKAVTQAAAFTTQLTEVITRVNGNASVVVSEATRAADVARDGSNKVKETVKGIETIQTSVGLSADKVKEMGQRTQQIESIIEAIDTIASQTNLLALNAAIEAARAGAHGKGFAVVADEVRKLADRASNSTHEIAAIIASIQESVGEAVAAMEMGSQQVNNGVSRAHEAGQALTEILSAVEAVTQRASGTLSATEKMHRLSDELTSAMEMVSSVVEQNTATTEEMSADSSMVLQAVENIASIAEQNSAAVEQVGATAEEMSAQASELSHAASDLSQMATTVTDLISRFKI
jgi:methyl-accepting chemotaxis protein